MAGTPQPESAERMSAMSIVIRSASPQDAPKPDLYRPYVERTVISFSIEVPSVSVFVN